MWRVAEDSEGLRPSSAGEAPPPAPPRACQGTRPADSSPAHRPGSGNRFPRCAIGGRRGAPPSGGRPPSSPTGRLPGARARLATERAPDRPAQGNHPGAPEREHPVPCRRHRTTAPAPGNETAETPAERPPRGPARAPGPSPWASFPGLTICYRSGASSGGRNGCGWPRLLAGVGSTMTQGPAPQSAGPGAQPADHVAGGRRDLRRLCPPSSAHPGLVRAGYSACQVKPHHAESRPGDIRSSHSSEPGPHRVVLKRACGLVSAIPGTRLIR